MASYFSLSEQDMLTIYQSPYSMIGSDTICSEKKGPAHPRAYGSFIKPIADFALKRHLITIEEAIHKQTGLTASVWKLPNKGLIRDGFDADLFCLMRQNCATVPILRTVHRLPKALSLFISVGNLSMTAKTSQRQDPEMSFIIQGYSSTFVFRISSLTRKIMAGETDNSSNPILRKVEVSVVSAPSSPQIPTQQPCL